jgi:hypothetical protein
MSAAPEERVAIALNVAPAFEERVVDWLLARDAASGFTSYAAFGHGARQDELSLAEQVQGRQRRIEFRVELPNGALDAFVAALTASFAGTDLYYYVTPVLRSGHLRRIVK